MTWSRESQAFGIRKSLGIVLLLFAVSAASGAPTINSSSGNVAECAVSTSRDEHVFFAPEVTQTAESCNPHLAAAAAEFLKPPADFTGPVASLPAYAKPLPAVPRTVFMVLVGFLCVSLVKDRRVWLAALTGLLWAGQASVQAVPQLVLHLGHRNHTERQLHPEITYPYNLENSDRLRGDIEGTQYIGMLHHLAGIPEAALSFLRKQESKPTDNNEIRMPQFVRAQDVRCLISTFNYLVHKAEQLICFSPAFIFEMMPRSPPNQA